METEEKLKLPENGTKTFSTPEGLITKNAAGVVTKIRLPDGSEVEYSANKEESEEKALRGYHSSFAKSDPIDEKPIRDTYAEPYPDPKLFIKYPKLEPLMNKFEEALVNPQTSETRSEQKAETAQNTLPNLNMPKPAPKIPPMPKPEAEQFKPFVAPATAPAEESAADISYLRRQALKRQTELTQKLSELNRRYDSDFMKMTRETQEELRREIRRVVAELEEVKAEWERLNATEPVPMPVSVVPSALESASTALATPAREELVPIPRKKRREINVTPIPSGPTIIPPPPAPTPALEQAPPAPTTPPPESTTPPVTPNLVLPRRPRGPVAPTPYSGPIPPILTPPPVPPQTPKEDWFKKQRRKILIGLGIVAAGTGGYVAKEVFSNDKPPTPAVSPMTKAELEARLAQARAEAMLETEKRLAEEAVRAIRAESQTINTTIVESAPDNKAAEAAAKLRAQMEEIAAKHQQELAAVKALREKLQADMDAKAKADAEKKVESAKRKPIRLPGQVQIVEKPVTTATANTSDSEFIERARRGGRGGQLGGVITTDTDPNNPYR